LTQKKEIIVKDSNVLVTGGKLEEKSKTWLACAIDAEGGIYLYHRKKKNGTWDGYQNQIAITNTNLDFLKHAQKLMKGRIRPIHKKDKRRSCFQLRICSQSEIINILEQILPYLIVKKTKALKMLKFLRSHCDLRRKENDN
jgi:hypothetical protein